MNQAKVTNLVSRLNYKVQDKSRRLKSFDGPEGRVRKIQKTLTALLKYERIELYYNRADEVRGYADRVIINIINIINLFYLFIWLIIYLFSLYQKLYVMDQLMQRQWRWPIIGS